MIRLFKYAIAVFVVGFLFIVSPSRSEAQTALTPAQEQALRDELSQVEKQIQEQQSLLKSKQGEAVSISRDISILDAKIKQAKLKIRAHEISIQNLGKDIEVKKNTITALGERIDKGRESLSQILQRTEELDNFSTLEAFLSDKDLSDFFIEFDTYASVKRDLGEHLNEVTTAKTQNEQVKQELTDKQKQEIFRKVNVEDEKKSIEISEAEKKRLLSLNQTDQNYAKKTISDKQARATQIRNALFPLRDSASIKFGDAVTYAKIASQKTGVRTAFLLAIIQQESNLGSNVGQCRLTDRATGAGVRVSSGAYVANVMKPSRDVAPFLTITAEVGRDPVKQVVSCPFSVGYGGAMGPAQFIPSTWALIKSRVATALGKSVPDPWIAQDAFMASAMYLADLGAANATVSAEKNAACKYYSGKSCGGSNTFYGSQVIDKANKLQGNIDILQNS